MKHHTRALVLTFLLLSSLFMFPTASATTPGGSPCVTSGNVYRNPTNTTEHVRFTARINRIDLPSNVCNGWDADAPHNYASSILSGFVLRRSLSFSNDITTYTIVANVSDTGTFDPVLEDYSTSPNITYHYRVQAYGNAGPVTQGGPASGDWTVCRCADVAPFGVTITGYSSRSITIRATIDASQNTAPSDVYTLGSVLTPTRATLAKLFIGTQSNLADQTLRATLTTPMNTLTNVYSFTGLAPSTTYYIRVFGANNESAGSAYQVNFTTPGSGVFGEGATGIQPTLSLQGPVIGYNPGLNAITSLAWRPQDDYALAWNAGGNNQSLKIFTTLANFSMQLKGNLTVPGGNVNDVAWSPDGSKVVLALRYQGIAVYGFNGTDTSNPTLTLLYQLTPAVGFWESIAWSVNDDIATVNGVNTNTKLLFHWDGSRLQNGTWSYTPTNENNAVFVSFSKDGSALFSGKHVGSNSVLEVSRVITGTNPSATFLQQTTSNLNAAHRLVWDPSGSRAFLPGVSSNIYGDGSWDGDNFVQNVVNSAAYPNASFTVSFAPTNLFAATTGCSNSTSGPGGATLMNYTTGALVNTNDPTMFGQATTSCPASTPGRTIAWSPWGGKILSCDAGSSPRCRLYNTTEPTRPRIAPIVTVTTNQTNSTFQADVRWSAVSGASTYDVFRWVGPNPPSVSCAIVFTCTMNSTGFTYFGSGNNFSWSDATVNADTNYTYAVLGSNIQGEGPPSLGTVNVPSEEPPAGVTISGTEVGSPCVRLNITWNASVSPRVNNYRLVRGEAAASTTLLGNVTSTIQNLVSSNSTFTVYAISNTGLSSAASNTLSFRACDNLPFADGGSLSGDTSANSQALFGQDEPQVFLWFWGFILMGILGTGLGVLMRSPLAGMIGSGVAMLVNVAVGWWSLWVAIFITVVLVALIMLTRGKTGTGEGTA